MQTEYKCLFVLCVAAAAALGYADQDIFAVTQVVNATLVIIKAQMKRIQELTDTVRSAQRLVSAMRTAHNSLVDQTRAQREELRALQAWAVEAEKAVGAARTFWRGTR
jgi:hypothetical protein